jgi:hypothetical protein
VEGRGLAASPPGVAWRAREGAVGLGAGTPDAAMRGLGLTAKITLPFAMLFAFLLAVLGGVLVWQISREVEARLEQEQRFVLSVAAHPRLPLTRAFLVSVRDQAAADMAEGLRPAPRPAFRLTHNAKVFYISPVKEIKI